MACFDVLLFHASGSTWEARKRDIKGCCQNNYAVKCNLTELTTKSASVVWSQRCFIHGHAPDPMCSSTEVCRSVLGH